MSSNEIDASEIISVLDNTNVVRLLDTTPRTNFFETVTKSSEGIIKLNERVVDRGEKVREMAEDVIEKPDQIKYIPYDAHVDNEFEHKGFVFIKRIGESEIEVSIPPDQIPKSITEHVFQGSSRAVLDQGSSPGEIPVSFIPTADMIEDLHEARDKRKQKSRGKTRKKFDETTSVKITWDKSHTEYVRNYFASGHDVASGGDVPLRQTRWTVVKESTPLGLPTTETTTVICEPGKHPQIRLQSTQGTEPSMMYRSPRPLMTQELIYPSNQFKRLRWSKSKFAYRPGTSSGEQIQYLESGFHDASIDPFAHTGWHVEAAGQYDPSQEKTVWRSAVTSMESTQPNLNKIDGEYIAQHPLLSEAGIVKDGKNAPDIKTILDSITMSIPYDAERLRKRESDARQTDEYAKRMHPNG